MSQPFEDIEWARPPEDEKLDILQEQAAFFQDLADLVATLPSVKQPASETHAYAFALLPFSTPVEFPAAIKPLAPQIDVFYVHLGDPHIAESDKDADIPAYLSIDFHTQTDMYTVSRSGEHDTNKFALMKVALRDYRHGKQDSEFDQRIAEVGTISKAELNAFVMSIVLPNEANDYSAYADKEIQSSDAYASLNELLGIKALDQTDIYHFILDDEETDIHFIKEHGQIVSITIGYYDRLRNVPITVEYDLGTEFVLRFFSIEEDEKLPITPTADEVNYLRLILTKELSKYSPDFFATVKRDGIGDQKEDDKGDTGSIIEPESASTDYEHILSNELSALVDTTLDQLGLNPPNSSA